MNSYEKKGIMQGKRKKVRCVDAGNQAGKMQPLIDTNNRFLILIISSFPAFQIKIRGKGVRRMKED